MQSADERRVSCERGMARLLDRQLDTRSSAGSRARASLPPTVAQTRAARPPWPRSAVASIVSRGPRPATPPGPSPNSAVAGADRSRRQQRVEVHARPDAAGDAALRQRARASPPSETSWAPRERRRARTASRHGRKRVRDRLAGRRRAARRRARRAASRARTRPATGGTGRPARPGRPPRRSAMPGRVARGRAARRPCRPPASGRSAPRRPRCRARRCRPPPAPRAPRQAAARPSTARVSCQAMCGFSGLPKLRQLVSPSGSAPTQARLRRTRAPPRPRPSTDRRRRAGRCRRSRPRSRPCRRRGRGDSTAASAASGRRTVREPDDRVVLLERPALGWRRSASASSAQQRRRAARRRRRAAAGGAG